MKHLLRKATFIFSIFLFILLISSFFQVYSMYHTRGITWEIITIYDGVEEDTQENIWMYVLGILLFAVLFIIVTANYLKNKELQEKLDYWSGNDGVL